VRTLPRTGRKELLIWCALTLLAVLAAGSVRQGFLNALAQSQDFEWSASRVLLMHQNPYVAYLDYLAGRSSEKVFLMSQFPSYPAYSLVLLWPFAAMPWPVAQMAWAVSNIVLAVGIVFFITALYFKDGRTPAVFLLLLFSLLASTPYRVTLGNGQHGLFSLFFFLAAIYAADKNRPYAASLLLAVAWFKYSVTFPLSLLFLRRDRFGIAIAAAAIDLALMGLAAAWTNSSIVDMFEQLFVVQGKSVANGYLDVFDILGFLGGLRWPAAFLLASLVVAASLWIVVRKRLEDELLLLSLLSFAACIATIHLIYDFVMYVLPLAYAVRSLAGHARRPLSGSLAISFVAAVVPIWYVQRIVEALHQSHGGSVSAFAMWLCWAWIIASTYGAFGFCVFACLRSPTTVDAPVREVRAATG
jgi:hypothetical protein